MWSLLIIPKKEGLGFKFTPIALDGKSLNQGWAV